MYLDSGNMIQLPTKSANSDKPVVKEAQNLEVVKTPETYNDRELSRAIRDAIIAEEAAIKQYEVAADATNNDKVKEVLQDIANEEKVHVGDLQKLLDDLEPEEEELMEEGEEGEEDVEDVEDVED